VNQPTPPRLLTIAGSDSGGGAGIQADLKTFAAHGVFGMTAVTAVTAQNTVSVEAVHTVPSAFVTAQIEAVLDDIGADVVKIGMLGNTETIRVVANALRSRPRIPVVLDPVMVAKSGDRLLETEAVSALEEHLMPLADLVTPNIPEAEILAHSVPGELTADGLIDELISRGARGVLLKGGHAEGKEVVDVLRVSGKSSVFRHPRVATTSTHGTGCTLSAAIAARLAKGDDAVTAVSGAIGYLQRALEQSFVLGAGHGPVNHLARGAE